MGIKYSEGPMVFRRDLRSDSSAHLRSDLDDALGAAGWLTKAAITDGFKYTITSPQALTCKVKIWDAGGTDYISIQFLSEDELMEGKVHRLHFGAVYSDLGYQIVANQCQLFLGIPGVSVEVLVVGKFQYSVAGGIPYVAAPIDPECSAEEISSAATSRIFWSCGTGFDAFALAPNFRNSRYCFKDYSHLWNNSLYVSPATQPADASTGGQLALYPLTPTNNVDHSAFVPPRIVKYGNGDPLYIDALIGWEWRIRGQLWDAFMVSRDMALDSTLTTEQTDDGGGVRTEQWIDWNYNLPSALKGGGGTYFASLYLLTNSMGEGHNVAY